MKENSRVIFLQNYNNEKGIVNSNLIDFSLGMKQVACAREEVMCTMDDNKILEKYIDSVSQNTREMERRLTENRIESEKRIEEQRRLSEERMEKRYLEVMRLMENTNKNIDNKVQSVEDKMDDTKKWIIALCITTIIGIAAMVLTAILA